MPRSLMLNSRINSLLPPPSSGTNRSETSGDTNERINDSTPNTHAVPNIKPKRTEITPVRRILPPPTQFPFD